MSTNHSASDESDARDDSSEYEYDGDGYATAEAECFKAGGGLPKRPSSLWSCVYGDVVTVEIETGRQDSHDLLVSQLVELNPADAEALAEDLLECAAAAREDE